NYYPFGLKHKGYNDYVATNNKYKYQGQERQDELGLNWDSFKWRNYDPAIGRFMCIDPLAQKYTYNSTYAFQENKMGLGRELEGLELVSPILSVEVEFAPVESVAPEMSIALEGMTVEAVPRISIWETVGNFVGDFVSKLAEAVSSGSDVKTDLVPKNAMEKAVDNAKPATAEPTARGTAGKLEKSARGKGTVAPADRDKQRVKTAKGKAKEREENDNKCANCGNETKAEDTESHHYPDRHADGGKESVPVCKDCHTYLHSKD
ncbi:RHS repeat-associated core domain-containing protein, partial [Flavobacterium sp. ANB]